MSAVDYSFCAVRFRFDIVLKHKQFEHPGVPSTLQSWEL